MRASVQPVASERGDRAVDLDLMLEHAVDDVGEKFLVMRTGLPVSRRGRNGAAMNSSMTSSGALPVDLELIERLQRRQPRAAARASCGRTRPSLMCGRETLL